MPPYCKLHDTFHTTEECEFEKVRAERARLAAIKERQAAERQKRAERIADRLIDDYANATDRPDDLQTVRGLLADAALAALNERG